MTLFYNALGSQNVGGSTLQDRYYAFTYDGNFDHVLADATVASFVWATGIRSSATAYFTYTASSIQTSSDFFNGLENTDIVYGSNGRDAILYNNGLISGGIGSFAAIEQFYLGSGDDFIDLSAHGASGIDYAKTVLIHGDNGNDTIIGGAGTDTIYGDDGDDLIFGYRGADVVYGGGGADTIYGDDLGFNGIAGDDTLYGQAGDDILYGGARTDRLEGGDGNDTLYGGLGGDTLLGGTGADVLYGDDAGTGGNDQLYGEAGNDQLFGGMGNDELRGGSGDDTIEGAEGIDFLIGDAGNDRLSGGAGADTIDGAADVDTVVYGGNFADYSFTPNTDGSMTVSDLRAGSPDGTDIVRNVEFFQFADRLVPAGQLNQPPVITSDGGGSSAVLSIAENTTAVTTVAAVDPDNGQTVAYSIAGGADAALFQIDALTGALSFVSAPNFENPTDAGGDNQYDIVVRATDSVGAFDAQTLAITVTDVVDGSPPVITSNGGGASAAVTIDENASAVTTVTAADPDGPATAFSIAGGADAARFSIDALTGALSFVSAPDFEAPADADGNNVYVVTVRASDGDNIDQQVISVTVANVNDNAPAITSNGGGATATVSATENQTAVTTVVAVDPDGAAPAYAIVGGADAALFGIDAQTGALAFLAAPDFEVPGDADGDNVYRVTVQASDGVNVDQQAISVSLGNANDNAPVITSDGGGNSAAFAISENQSAVTTVAATDADGTAPTYSIAGGADAARFSIDALTGALAFIAAPDFEVPTDADQDNVYSVIVRAGDGANFDQQSISVTVGNVNDNAPVITSNGGGASAAVTAAENQTAVTTVVAVDADGAAPVYAITGGADAALFTIDAQTGALAFLAAPDFEAPGDADGNNVYQVTVQAGDGVNADQQSISVTVGNANDNAPVITSNGGGASASLIVAENQTAVTTVAASDADGPVPAYSISGGADAALFQIDAQTGVLAFVAAPDFEAPADADHDGIYQVLVRASDGAQFDEQSLAVTVSDQPDSPPVITSNGGGATAAVNVAENGVAVTTVIATDADGTVPSYLIFGGADAALFQIDAQSGALVFKVAPDFETPGDADQNGVYDVIVRATDGVYFDDQQLSVTVTDVFEGGRTITGSSGNNVISPTATNPAFVTTALNDIIYALAGNDTIDGGQGADRMEGGTGNDIYYVDTYSADGISANDDLVVELVNEGTDIVNAAVGYILTANVENLLLTGVAAIYGTGNDLDNALTGNDAANILTGLGGNDVLDGKGGADTLIGGLGNDTYYVDAYSSDGNSANDDQVTELAGGGIDLVNAVVSYVLASEVENLTLAGAAAIDGTGNALANTVIGNSAANTLSGLDGDDTINGNAGADVVFGGNGNDTINGGTEADTLWGEAGTDTILGGAGEDLIDGGAGTDTLSGQSGADVLTGGLGKDTMTGGSEGDTFRFAVGDTTILSTSYDTITDFVTGVDRIDLDFLASPLNPSAYVEGTIGTNVFADALTAARSMLTAGKQVAFVAGTTDGWLFWDSNADATIDQSIFLKSLGSVNAFYSGDVI